MYEDGQPVDSMKVVVGKPDAADADDGRLHPPCDPQPVLERAAELLRKTIAAGRDQPGRRLSEGARLRSLRDWDEGAEQLDPKAVDWQAAKQRRAELPRAPAARRHQFMGNVKYEFPNAAGDLPPRHADKEYMLKDVRQLSNGCVRLEDAEALGRWLLGGELPREGAGPETRVDLAEPVPIYITYLTAAPEGETIALRPDPYGLDALSGPALARAD